MLAATWLVMKMAYKWDKGDGDSAKQQPTEPLCHLPKNHVTHRIPERTYCEENIAPSKLKAKVLDICMSLCYFSNVYKSQFLFKAIRCPVNLSLSMT